MAQQIKFRQEALQQLTSPEQLDQLIRVVSPRSWLIAITFYAIIFIILIWSIIGNIPTRVEGKGILLAGGGDIYNAVAPDGPSRVVSLLVKAGDQVTKGQMIASLARPDLLDQIKVTQNYLADLQNKFEKLTETSQKEIIDRQKDISDQKTSLQRVLISSQEKLKHLGELLAIKQAAFKKGYETRQNVEQTFQKYYNVKSEIEGYTDKLIQLNISESNFYDQWRERLRELELKITDEKLKLANLQTRLTLSTDVVSPVNGIVTEIRTTIGNIVETGAPLASIASQGNELDALVYLPPQAGKRIKPGMRALVSPNTAEKAEYGSIYGNVIAVSNFPTNPEAMNAALQNEELVKQFSRDEVPITVRIHLQTDPTTFSGLKWSSSSGPQQKITPGTLANAMITIREQAPITLVIPTLKKMTGTE